MDCVLTQESVKQMKKVVEELEETKRQLLMRSSSSSSSSSTRGGNPSMAGTLIKSDPHARHPLQDDGLLTTDTSASATAAIQRDDFVRLTEQIEQLRLANAALARDLHERDLFNSSMQHLLLDFRKEAGDHDNDGNESEERRHLRQRELVGFTPLRPDEAELFVSQALQQCRNARLNHAAEGHYRSTAKVFGWSDFRARHGSTITFSVKKRIANVRSADLLMSLWDCVTDSTKIGQLLPAAITCDLRVLQRVSDSVLIIDRRTYTRTQSPLPAMPTLRTVMVVLRAHDPSDGSDVLIMKTLDSPLVKNLLLHDEVWCDVFYYMRFEPPPSSSSSGVVIAEAEQEEEEDEDTTMEFGGILTYVREEMAASWVAELLFLAVRWESIAVRPVLLKAS